MRFALPAMSGPAVVGDYSVIEQIVKARARQPDIARFAWIDNSGHAVAAFGPRIKVEAPAGSSTGSRFPSLEQSQPVVVGGEKYGTVFLRLDPAVSVNTALARLLGRRSASSCWAPALSLGVTLVVLRAGVRPLRDLAASARRFGEGDYAVRISCAGPPETAQCIQAFNSMAENIESLLAIAAPEPRRRTACSPCRSSNRATPSSPATRAGSSPPGTGAPPGSSATARRTPSAGRWHELDLLDRQDSPRRRGADPVPDGSALDLDEVRAKTRSGQLVEVSVVVTPLFDEAGVRSASSPSSATSAC